MLLMYFSVGFNQSYWNAFILSHRTLLTEFYCHYVKNIGLIMHKS